MSTSRTTTGQAGTTDGADRPRSGPHILASQPLMGWRTVDILTIAFLGVAFGIAYWGWGIFYNGPISALKITFMPAFGLFAGPWFIAGIVGGLVVRRPGAALFCEVVAALASMLPGTEWGATVLLSGVLQGLGAELAFALLAYRSFGWGAAALAGLLSVPFEWVYEMWFTWGVDWSMAWRLVYLVTMSISGVVLAGLLGWAITRALARAGALNPFPPGQELREQHAV